MDAQWQKMAPIEQLMLLETEENNPVFITAIFSIAANPSLGWLKENLIPRALCHPRFCSVVHRTKTHKFRYELLPGFTPTSSLVDRHIEILSPIDADATFDIRHDIFTKQLNQILSSQLPRDRPLWKLFVFPTFSIARNSADDDCSTIVLRVHHSIADGIGLVKYFAAKIIDGADEKAPADILVVPGKQKAALTKQPPNTDGQINNAGIDQNATGNTTSTLIPPPPKRGITTFLTDVVHGMYRSTIAPLFPELPNVFTRSPITQDKVCAIVPPTTFSIQVLKEASQRLGVTINDLLFTAVSGATAAYLEEHGDNIKELSGLRIGIPMNRHMFCDFEISDVSNQMTASPIPLNIHADSLEERLKLCVDSMRELKRGTQAKFSLAALRVVSWLPIFIRYPLWKHLTRCASLLFTNVPGPRNTVAVCGVPVECIYFFAPGDGHSGVTVNLFSYNGGICLGIQGDKGRVSDPQRYVDLLKSEIEALIQLSKT